MAKNDSNISNMKPTLFTITLRAVASAAILSLTASATTGNAQSVVPLIVIDNVPLPDAIRNLARQFDLNYILDPRVPGSDFGPGRVAAKPMVSGRWTNSSANEALGALLSEHKLVMVTNSATSVARIAPANLGVKPIPASQVAPDTNGVIPLLVLEDVPLSDTIKKLGSQAGLKILMEPTLSASLDPQGTVSLRWQKITVRQALAALIDNYGLVMTQDPATASAKITLKSAAQTDAPPRSP
jgi:hypothetical protein